MTQNLPPDLPRNADECKNDTKHRSEAVRLQRCFHDVIDLEVLPTPPPVTMNLDALDPRHDLARQHLKNRGSGNALAAGREEASWTEELFFRGRRSVSAQKRRMPCDNPTIVAD